MRARGKGLRHERGAAREQRERHSPGAQQRRAERDGQGGQQLIDPELAGGGGIERVLAHLLEDVVHVPATAGQPERERAAADDRRVGDRGGHRDRGRAARGGLVVDPPRAGLGADAAEILARIAAPQLALVEPGLDARCAQRIANALSSFRILRGVAQEHRLA